MRLLTVENAKTSKGESLGYLTGILYLAPANEAKTSLGSLCPMSSPGCRAGCLYTAGRGKFRNVIAARKRKTEWLAKDREGFVNQLRLDVVALVKQAKKLRLIPAIRLNGTSDLSWLGMRLASEFPNIQFYDYSKNPKPYLRTRPNYHLTFSLSENNLQHALDALRHRMNCAVVFNVKKGNPLPATWNGYTVVDGDTHDLRFLNGYNSLVIGLRAKGEAKLDTLGFVQIAPNLSTSIAALPMFNQSLHATS